MRNLTKIITAGLILSLLYLFFVKSVHGQKDNTVFVTMLSTEEEAKSGERFNVLNLVRVPVKLIWTGIDTYVLHHQNGPPFTYVENGKVVEIFGTGDDIGLDNINSGELFFQCFTLNTEWIFKKLIEEEMQAYQRILANYALGSDPAVYQDITSVGYVENKRFIVHFKVGLADVSVSGGGSTIKLDKYLLLKDFTLDPGCSELEGYPNFDCIDYKVELYFTFVMEDGSWIRFPAQKLNFSNFDYGPHKMRGLPDGLPSSLFNQNLTPIVTMVVYRRKKEVGTFYFDLGTPENNPSKPKLSMVENEHSLLLEWTPDINASSYDIFKSESPMLDLENLQAYTSTSGLIFEDLDVIPGRCYYYRTLPIRYDGLEGLLSNEVSGIATSPLIIDLSNSQEESHLKGSLFNISGQISSAKTGLPVDNTAIYTSIKELKYSFNGTESNLSDFDFEVETPAIPGVYTYLLSSFKDNYASGKAIKINSIEDENFLHDISIEGISIPDRVYSNDENVMVSVICKNIGGYTENGTIFIDLYGDDNVQISSVSHQYSQFVSGSVGNINETFTIGSSLPEGNYYFKATALNGLDQNRLNDFKRVGFYVSNVTNPPAYRLAEAQFDSVNHIISIDGYNVKLIDASPLSAMFTVSGENTGYLNVDDYWFNSNQNFLLTPLSIVYTNDTILDIKIRAGKTNTSFTYSPFHLVTSKDDTAIVTVTSPSGSILDTDFELIIDHPDSIYFQDWIIDAQHPNGIDHILELSVFIPKNELSATYGSHIKYEDISANNYWWVKKLHITPLKGHEIEKDGIINIQNLTAGIDPGYLTGDRFVISGSFSNSGEFNEEVSVRLSLDTDSSTLWFENIVLNIVQGNSESFNFTLPTLGVIPSVYILNVEALEPEDYNFSDNLFSQAFTLDSILHTDCYFESPSNPFESGDTIPLIIHVEHDGQSVSKANVMVSITDPAGVELFVPAIFSSANQRYETCFIANLGGNYHITANASARRYESSEAATVVKVTVHMILNQLAGKAMKGSIEEFTLSVSNVGGIYAIAGDFQFNEKFSLLGIYEGEHIKNSNDVQTSFIYSTSSNNVDFGITRLAPDAPNAAAFTEEYICSLSLLSREIGVGSIALNTCELFDKYGVTMAYDVNTQSVDIEQDTLLMRFYPTDTIYTLGDTVTMISSVLGAKNLAAITYDLYYNDTLLQYYDTRFNNTFGDYGDVELITDAHLNNPGFLSVGSSRAGSEINGSDLPVIKIAESRFIVKNSGYLSFEGDNIHLFSPFPGLEYAYDVDTIQALATPYDPNSLIFNPDTLLLFPEDSGWSQLQMSSSINAYAFAIELAYDTSVVKIITAIEGNLLNTDGEPTTFDYYNDSIDGKVYIGVSRLSPMQGGVSSDTVKTLLSIEVKKKNSNYSEVQTTSFKIIDVLGNEQNSYIKPNLILDSLELNTQAIGLAAGWNIISFYVKPQDENMMSILQSLIVNSNLVKAIDEGGGFIQDIPGYGWMNTIGDMENTEGYYVKVNSNDTIYLSGIPVSLPYNIPLYAGWNIMGYPVQLPQNAMDVLQPLVDAGVLIKVINESGGFVQYIPGFGWMNTIFDFEAGEGYYIKVNMDTSLTIYDVQTKQSLSNDFHLNSPPELRFYKPICYGNRYQPMHFIIKAKHSNNINFIQGDEIAIFDGDQCVGAGVLEGSGPYVVVAYADDPTTNEIDGYTTGNNLSIKYWNSEKGQETFDVNIQQLSGSNVFSPLETWFGSLDGINGSLLQDDIYLAQNRPNPFSSYTYIDYILRWDAHVSLQIFDIQGRIVMEVVDESQTSGFYTKKVDKENLKAGIYFIGITVDNDNGSSKKIKRMIIL